MAQMKGESREREYLNDLRKKRMSIAVYLVSGVKQSGMIESFDQYTVLLRQGDSTQVIYKHMISSILPATGRTPTVTSPPAQRTVSQTYVTATPAIIRKASRRIMKPDE
jgi:host factor-I protein